MFDLMDNNNNNNKHTPKPIDKCDLPVLNKVEEM